MSLFYVSVGHNVTSSNHLNSILNEISGNWFLSENYIHFDVINLFGEHTSFSFCLVSNKRHHFLCCAAENAIIQALDELDVCFSEHYHFAMETAL